MAKLQFALDVEDGWPPVATESVWCNVEGDVFELQNAPFFIKGLAWGDKFCAETDPVNGCIFEFKIVKESGHSLVWILKNDGADFSEYIAKFQGLGCRVEGFPAYQLWSLDVPPIAKKDELEALLDELESKGFAIAVPVWRLDG